MASTSASSLQKSFKYDVFLSFRGEDTRKTFVDHLYHALVDKGITTYKDDEEIEKGERISEQLIRSIEESRFYIIVFSKNYASSSWCLDELVKMMECQKMPEHTAYPIFYDVEPTEVRHQSGAVGEAFANLVAKHESSSEMFSFFKLFTGKRKRTTEDVDLKKEVDVGRWRNALKEAADLAGMDLKNTFNGHEADLVHQIVEKVSQKLHLFNFSFDGKLVGMEARVKNVVSSLDLDIDDVRVIGIKGMGGGGKTTLARAVFDKISISFEGKSFVENVREGSKGGSGLKNLQKMVLQNVLNDKSDITGVYEGQSLMKKRLCSRKVLLVLDDVDDTEQLEALAGELNWFKPGSRIIITTRDEQVLVAHRANFIHDVNLLSDEEAICLLSRHTFNRELPIKGYEDLSRNVVRYAAGLPLTIKVLGSHLCDRSEREWEDAIKRLETIPLKETLQKLELSYNGLERDQKEIFLDIACILKGKTKKEAIRILESCGFCAQIGLRVLEQKSLISISKENEYVIGNGNGGDYDGKWEVVERLLLHDHLEEMGKNIVRRLHPDEPKRHSRLWIDEEIKDVLVNESGTEETKCVLLSFTDLDPALIMKGLKKMTKLKLLYIEDEYKSDKSNEADEVCQYLPDTLQCLCWNRYPFSSLPKTFEANNLINLEMVDSNISELWEGGEQKFFNKLKFLDLQHSTLRTFDLSVTPHLEELNLGGCDALREFFLPDKSTNLKILTLHVSNKGNLNLRMIPHLEKLDLYARNEFELHMPDKCQNLKSLILRVRNEGNLNLEMIPHLEKLDLYAHNKFELHMPDKCQNLKSLILRVPKGNTNLNLEMIPHLEKLDLYAHNEFELHMPDKCQNLKSLILRVPKGNTNLNLEMTPHLEKLYVDACNDFELQMPVECLLLKDLKLDGCKVSNLNLELTPNLEILQIKKCYCLQKIHAPVGCLKKVVRCWLDNCSNFEWFNFKKGHKSTYMDSVATCSLHAQMVSKCPLHPKNNLPDFGFECVFEEPGSSLSGYFEKIISDPCACKTFEYLLATICGLQHLRELTLRGSIPGDPWQLESLQKLTLRDLKSEITHLPDSICMLRHLKSLKLHGCKGIEQLPENICRLEFLEELEITGSTSLRDIPNNICKLKCLKRLRLSGCNQVEKLPVELGCLECLEELLLKCCTSLQEIPNSICNLKRLKRLDLSECSQLEKLPEELGCLECLEVLEMNRWTSLRDIPNNICKLKYLKRLDLSECSQLEKLPEELGCLECLEELGLWRCESLRDIPNICKLKCLKRLDLSECSQLEKLPEELGCLECLEKLQMICCTSLRDIPNSICKLKCLKELLLKGCNQVEKLPEEFGCLECLEELDIDGAGISRLPQSIYQLKGLRIDGRKEQLESYGFTSVVSFYVFIE